MNPQLFELFVRQWLQQAQDQEQRKDQQPQERPMSIMDELQKAAKAFGYDEVTLEDVVNAARSSFAESGYRKSAEEPADEKTQAQARRPQGDAPTAQRAPRPEGAEGVHKDGRLFAFAMDLLGHLATEGYGHLAQGEPLQDGEFVALGGDPEDDTVAHMPQGSFYTVESTRVRRGRLSAGHAVDDAAPEGVEDERVALALYVPRQEILHLLAHHGLLSDEEI